MHPPVHENCGGKFDAVKLMHNSESMVMCSKCNQLFFECTKCSGGLIQAKESKTYGGVFEESGRCNACLPPCTCGASVVKLPPVNFDDDNQPVQCTNDKCRTIWLLCAGCHELDVAEEYRPNHWSSFKGSTCRECLTEYCDHCTQTRGHFNDDEEYLCEKCCSYPEQIQRLLRWLAVNKQSEQRSAAWHATRQQMLTMSDLGAVLGLDSRSAKAVFREKTDQLTDRSIKPRCSEYASAIMQEGVDSEDPVRRMLDTLYPGEGYDQISTDFGCVRHSDVPGRAPEDERFPWLGGSPDGIILKTGRVLEIKTLPIRELKLGQVPPKNIAQMQGLMEVFNLEQCDYVEYKPHTRGATKYTQPPEIQVIRVDRDRKWWAQQLPRLREFWQSVIDYRAKREQLHRAKANLLANHFMMRLTMGENSDLLNRKKIWYGRRANAEYEQLAVDVATRLKREKQLLNDIKRLDGELKPHWRPPKRKRTAKYDDGEDSDKYEFGACTLSSVIDDN